MQQEFFFPRAAEVLPPASVAATHEALERTRSELRAFELAALHQLLETQLQKQRGLAAAKLFRSGKAALLELFTALAELSSRRIVALSAYTCPDIAAAAVRAGFAVLPLDVGERDTRMDQALLERALDKEELAAVVLSNLYGYCDILSERLIASDVVVLDDACQSAFSRRNETLLGSDPCSIGVLSFGRGKALSGMGGGALLLPERALDDSLRSRLSYLLRSRDAQGSHNIEFFDRGRSRLQALFSRPRLYRIPASIPWLGIGETNCSLSFPLGTMSRTQCEHAITQVRQGERLQSQLEETAAMWRDAMTAAELAHMLLENPDGHDVVPTRIPLLFERPADRRRFLAAASEAGLGVSASYPAPLHAFEELRTRFLARPCIRAEKLARLLVTLPSHSLVTAEHIQRCISLLKQHV